MRGYDGSIRISTKIDEKGFNKGIKNLGTQVKSLGAKMADAALGLISGFTMAAGVISLVIFAVTRLIKSISRAVNRVINMGARTQGLKEDFEALKLSVRNAFMPLLQVALPLLQRVAQWLTVIFNLIGSVLAALMGQTEVMRATLDVSSDVTSNVSDLADETERTEEAAKGALAGFDEIDVLQMEQDEPADTGGPTVGGPEGDGFTMEPISQKILDFVQNIKDFFKPLWESLVRLWDAVKGLGEAIWNALAPVFGALADSGILQFLRDLAILGIEWLTEKIILLTDWINNNQEAFRKLVAILGLVALALLVILSPTAAIIVAILMIIFVVAALAAAWPVLKQKAIEAWEAITTWAANTLNSIGQFFTDAWEWIKRIWGVVSTWFIQKIWQPLTTWAANTLNLIGEFFTNAWKFIKGVWNTVSNWFKTNVWQPIKDAAKAIWDAIVELITTGSWSGIKAIWKTVSDWFITNVWNPLTDFADELGEDILSFFSDAWDGIKGVWKIVSDWFDTNVWSPISDWAEEVWSDISEWASEAWEDIKSVWETVTDWISTNIVDPIQKAFEDAWENITSAFETAFGSIVDFAKGVINSVIDFLNSMIQGVVSGMNGIINALNGISVSIPDWVPKIGGKTFGINLSTITAPQIPKLAQGAVIPPNSQFLAVLGDQRSGRNIETPEGLMRQIVREEMQGGQEVTINFAGSLGALVRELKPYIDKEDKRMGTSLVKGIS
jgi:phage-related protein